MAEAAVQKPKRSSGSGGVDSTPFVVVFLRQVVDELRKVVWPTPAELYRYTVVVIATVIVIGLFIGAADAAVSWFVAKFIYKA